MATSKYEKLLKELMIKRCERCHGSGMCDDAEPGDISYRAWVCKDCNGKGMKDGN